MGSGCGDDTLTNLPNLYRAMKWEWKTKQKGHTKRQPKQHQKRQKRQQSKHEEIYWTKIPLVPTISHKYVSDGSKVSKHYNVNLLLLLVWEQTSKIETRVTSNEQNVTPITS